MGTLFDPGIFSVVGLSGDILPGAKLYWYEAGTSTPQATYADPDLTIPNTNPVLAQGDGRFPSIWLQPESYKLVLTDEDGVVLHTQDDIASMGAPDAASLIGYKYPSNDSYARTVGSKLDDWVSVLDFIPKSKHASIRAGTNTDDLTSYFQKAAAAAASAVSIENQYIATVYVPNGLYHVSRVGIRGTAFIGESREGTVIAAIASGAGSDFIMDAMIDRDGVTPNTLGNGWCRNLSIEGKLPNGTNSGRSGLRTYGGGQIVHEIDVRNCSTGLAIGLPIWATITNCYARNCNVGFYTFHNEPGDNGTSTTFQNCWALDCVTYGFHISQIYYSVFMSCVSQNAGVRNFYVQGDLNGTTACYYLEFISCATEGGGVPFYFRRCRNLRVSTPAIIIPSNNINYITFDDTTGAIENYSTAGAPSSGYYHLDVINHSGGLGSILLNGGSVTYDPTQANENYITIGAGIANGVCVTQIARIQWSDPDNIANRVYAQVADVDGTKGLTFFGSGGSKLARFKRTGTPVFLTNGPIASPSTNLQDGDVSFAANGNQLDFQWKIGGTVYTASIVGS